MMRYLAPVLVTVMFVFFQNCAGFHASVTDLNQSSNGSTSASQTLSIDPTLNSQAIAILTTNCAACHGSVTSGGVTGILDVNHDISAGLIVVGNPTTSTIISAIQTGGMPVGGTLAAADLTTLKNWIASMHYVGNQPAPMPTPGGALPAGKTVIADATLHNQAMTILNTNCAACHEGVTSGGVTAILEINALVANGLVVPGDSTQGTLLSVIQSGTMPAGNGARVTAADQQTLKNWINSMTIVDQSVAPTPMPTRHVLDATFSGVFANVIQPKCLACHGPVKSTEFNLNSYAAVKANANNILSKTQNNSMPESPYPVLTSDELAALKTWIQNGEPNN